ncbi:MAG: hypothetical protein RLZZ414_2139 [Bacteroidota bacterium]|jgi:hypothetical protein
MRRKSKKNPTDPHQQMIINTSFVSPKGAKCRFMGYVEGTNCKKCHVLNLETNEMVIVDYALIKDLLPKWNVNKQENY